MPLRTVPLLLSGLVGIIACGDSQDGPLSQAGQSGSTFGTAGTAGVAGAVTSAGASGEGGGASGLPVAGSAGSGASGSGGMAPPVAGLGALSGTGGDMSAAGAGGGMGAAGTDGGTSAAGTGGGMGAAGGGMGASGTGDDGGAGTGPAGCLPEFQEVCWPNIDFENRDPGNSANFDAVIDDVEAEMRNAACTVCSIMYRSAEEVPRTHDTIAFVIDDHDGVAYASGNEIHLSTNHIQNYDNPERALVEFRGVMVHETAHLYQMNGASSDGALIEGIADFVRIRVGLYGPGRRNNGGSWDDAYTTSGFFFSWLAGPCEYHDDYHPENDLDIGYRLNLLMPEGKDAIREELEEAFGTDIDSLWQQYQEAI